MYAYRFIGVCGHEDEIGDVTSDDFHRHGGGNMQVSLKIDQKQRTIAAAKGYGVLGDKLTLYVSEDVYQMLDPDRVAIDSKGNLQPYFYISVWWDEDIKEMKLAEGGRTTKIESKLVDYILENSKKTFDADCVRKLYELQDEAYKEIREETIKYIEAKKAEAEKKRKIEEAKEILKKELKELEERIENERQKRLEREKRIEELEEMLAEMKTFIEEKNLVEEFIDYTMKKVAENERGKIREKYGFEDCDC